MWMESCQRCIWNTSQRGPRAASLCSPCCLSAPFAGSWSPSSFWTWASSCQGSTRWGVPIQLSLSLTTNTHCFIYNTTSEFKQHLVLFKQRCHIFCVQFLTMKYFSRPDLLLCRQHICQCRSQAQWHPVCDCGNRCSECLHDNSCCRYPLLNIWKSLWVNIWGENEVYCLITSQGKNRY